MIEKDDVNDALEEANMIERPAFTPPRRSSTENDPHSEFILWGYKVIENEDQSKQSMLMPIYRVIPSDCSNTRLSITHPTINGHQREDLPSLTSSSLTSSSMSMQPTPLSQYSLMSAVPNGSGHHYDTQNDQVQSLERQKSSRQQYSPEVTKCLKQAFVDTIGQDRKLTKDLRKKIMHKTGLNSRSLTYWFSNRKRRPPFLAQQFKHSVKQSRGQVKTYEDFELWWALSKKKK